MSKLSTEQKLAINMKVARGMWPDAAITSSASIEGAALVDRSFLFNIFDPEKGDLSKAVEFYGIDVVWFINSKSWGSRLVRSIDVYFDKSRDISMQKAIIAASGANQTNGDK